MNRVRVIFTHPGIADFQVDYGEKRAQIRVDGLGTTGGPEEDRIAWEAFYRKCMEELIIVIQADDTQWKFSGSE